VSEIPAIWLVHAGGAAAATSVATDLPVIEGRRGLVARASGGQTLDYDTTSIRRREEMKVETSVVFRFQSSSLAETGAVLDEILGRARERDDIEIAQINVTTPPGSTPVSLPAFSAPASTGPAWPRSGGVDEG
jgi:hypothetical protein